MARSRLFVEVQAAGYPGGYGRVYDYVREARPREPVESVERFETPPGHQGQVDFGTFTLPWGRRHALLVVLGHSRLLWLRFYASQTMAVQGRATPPSCTGRHLDRLQRRRDSPTLSASTAPRNLRRCRSGESVAAVRASGVASHVGQGLTRRSSYSWIPDHLRCREDVAFRREVGMELRLLPRATRCVLVMAVCAAGAAVVVLRVGPSPHRSPPPPAEAVALPDGPGAVGARTWFAATPPDDGAAAPWAGARRVRLDANQWRLGDRVNIPVPQEGVVWEGVVARVDTSLGSRSYAGTLRTGGLVPHSFVVTVGEANVFATVTTPSGAYELVGDTRLAWLVPAQEMWREPRNPDYWLPPGR